jgi:hypothetical protein
MDAGGAEAKSSPSGSSGSSAASSSGTYSVIIGYVQKKWVGGYKHHQDWRVRQLCLLALGWVQARLNGVLRPGREADAMTRGGMYIKLADHVADGGDPEDPSVGVAEGIVEESRVYCDPRTSIDHRSLYADPFLVNTAWQNDVPVKLRPRIQLAAAIVDKVGRFGAQQPVLEGCEDTRTLAHQASVAFFVYSSDSILLGELQELAAGGHPRTTPTPEDAQRGPLTYLSQGYENTPRVRDLRPHVPALLDFGNPNVRGMGANMREMTSSLAPGAPVPLELTCYAGITDLFLYVRRDKHKDLATSGAAAKHAINTLLGGPTSFRTFFSHLGFAAVLRIFSSSPPKDLYAIGEAFTQRIAHGVRHKISTGSLLNVDQMGGSEVGGINLRLNKAINRAAARLFALASVFDMYVCVCM